jgi:CRP-like cAMP-binding protein
MSISLFDGLSKKERRRVSRLSSKVTFPAGTTLAREGASGSEMFVVVDGVVDVYRSGELVASRGPGSPVGETALLEQQPRNATLVTKTRVTALVSHQQEFDALVEAVPLVSERLRTIAAQRQAA